MISIHANFSLAGSAPDGSPGIVTPMTADVPTQAERAVKLITARPEYQRMLLDVDRRERDRVQVPPLKEKTK